MEVYIPTTDKEFSQRKIEEYAKFEKVINWGRKDPIRFSEEFFGIKLIDYQKWCFMETWDKPFALWLCSRGTGKALSLDTKIPTPYGYKLMRDIKIGDTILTEKGEPTNVTYISPIHYNHDCYEIEFSDGEKIIADSDHLWNVSSKSSRVSKIKDTYFTINTKSLLNDFVFKRQDGNVEYNYHVKMNDAIKYEEKNLPLHPYILGIWLGDGHKSSARITSCDKDIDEMCSIINSCGCVSKIYHNKNRASSIGIDTCVHGGNHKTNYNKTLNALKELNVFENKHIPEIYMYSSIEQRLELLKGLMDTDGSCDKRGLCEFSQKDYNLAKQVSTLLFSLGIKNTLRPKKAKLNGKEFVAYRITFYTTKSFPCFKLNRKYERLKTNIKLLSNEKSIINIKRVESVPTKCIQVDNKTHLYLCGEHFTVTHNTTLAAVYLQTKMLLIPDYHVFVSANSLSQSIDCFKKIESLALQRIPSFKTVTDVFAAEVEKSANSETGFLHNPAGNSFQLYNNSSLLTLSTNLNAIRGKRGSVYYDETSWQSREQMAATEHYADVDASFGLGVEKIHYHDPIQMPLQLLYASSAGDVTFPFYEKYVTFAKKMFLGNRDYFVCDIDANDVVNFSTVDGEKIKSHLTQAQIDKAVEEDPELADRELFNKFRKDGGQNAVLKMDTLIRNSEVRVPLLYNDTGKKKFIFCYDPARNFDGSVLSIYQLMNSKEYGYWLRVENVVSMVDTQSKHKTPLPMPEQLEIIKELMIKYNGERAAEWENIEFYVDSGSGGGGISAVCDQLMNGWTDKHGIKHRGIIDPEHKQYETARKKYTDAMPIVHLIDPQGYKKIIYDSLQKMANLNLIKFTDYDNKDYLLLPKTNGEYDKYELSFEEKLSLANINMMKTEVSYMCRYDTGNGGVQYELARDKKNTMHDDRA